MDDNSALILLTYKGKALLMYKYDNSIDEEKHEWSFLKSIKKGKESSTNALSRTVLKDAGIKVDKFEFLGDNYYHSELTDSEVNNIKRDELQLLNFFTLNEIKKLKLSQPTRDFVNQYGNLI